MATRTARREARTRLRQVEILAWVLIVQKKLSATGLARELGVSVITAKRIVSSLRRLGREVVSVRSGKEFYYEARDRLTDEELAQDPFVRAAGCIKSPRRKFSGSEEDRALYGGDD